MSEPVKRYWVRNDDLKDGGVRDNPKEVVLAHHHERAMAEKEAELRMIDEALARRPALADCPTRYDKISLACATAARAEKAEADRKVAWDRMAIHNKDADDAVARA
ncbi:MAG: hypothetical protein IMZ71_00345, partial [Chloroflexi bacterium]|nr:hypothetical protein [Chloroflexota bacterium]